MASFSERAPERFLKRRSSAIRVRLQIYEALLATRFQIQTSSDRKKTEIGTAITRSSLTTVHSRAIVRVESIIEFMDTAINLPRGHHPFVFLFGLLTRSRTGLPNCRRNPQPLTHFKILRKNGRAGKNNPFREFYGGRALKHDRDGRPWGAHVRSHTIVHDIHCIDPRRSFGRLEGPAAPSRTSSR